ncbi:DUF4157 domain-containing protein [Aureisphaera galaxeae]|uniref:eCIS core domain-containing protein n=1 Tax=Aureisphaera galaxeae TaxID=1538023 RepID=UPI0023509977|nr:DUF4157 domain-containing protein [Aureisphaera galaxeae]MDC8005362.1 DUF4157 domain-containing protein [Aureisphaera galaxeae]
MNAVALHKTKTPTSKITTSSPFVGAQTIKRKLAIGASNDVYEVEADRVADRVVGMGNSQVDSLTQTGSLVQRKCANCNKEESIQKKPIAETITPMIQKKGEGTGIASKALTQQIGQSKGGGHKMDQGTQSFMENRFGADFSQVNIHTGAEAIQMSRELSAKAFTVGNDIYFNEGQYSPESHSGKHLLAHELTHTIQQGGIGKNKIQRLPFQGGDPIHDPILDQYSEETGMPRDSASQHDPSYAQWLQGKIPRKTIWLNIGFDSSAKFNKTTFDKLKKSIAVERKALTHCCVTHAKACNIDLKVHYDYNKKNKPAPKDGDYDSDVAADRKLRDKNLDNITAPNGGVKVLVTESTLSQTWQGKRIFPRANAPAKGVVWNRKKAADDTIAHESGHKAGYVGNVQSNKHHSDPDNLMSSGKIRNANAKPDAEWCNKMAATAV